MLNEYHLSTLHYQIWWLSQLITSFDCPFKMHYVTFLVILALFDCNWKGEEPWIKSPSREKDKLLLIHYAFGKNSREVPLFSLSGALSGYNFGFGAWWCHKVFKMFWKLTTQQRMTIYASFISHFRFLRFLVAEHFRHSQ